MKNLTEKQFADRVGAVARARKIFIPHLTRDIGIAFALYQEVLAEQDRLMTLDTAHAGNRPRTLLDEYVRPSCPDCGAGDMKLRVINVEQGKRNVFGWKSAWVCTACWHEEYSGKTLIEWSRELKRKPSREG